MEKMTHDEYVRECVKKILRVAKVTGDRKFNPIDACLNIYDLIQGLGPECREIDDLWRGIETQLHTNPETEGFPLSRDELRERWVRDKAGCEEAFGEGIINDCPKVIQICERVLSSLERPDEN